MSTTLNKIYMDLEEANIDFKAIPNITEKKVEVIVYPEGYYESTNTKNYFVFCEKKDGKPIIKFNPKKEEIPEWIEEFVDDYSYNMKPTAKKNSPSM